MRRDWCSPGVGHWLIYSHYCELASRFAPAGSIESACDPNRGSGTYMGEIWGAGMCAASNPNFWMIDNPAISYSVDRCS